MLLFRDRFRSFFSFPLQFTVEKNCTIYAVCWCRLNRVINFVTCQLSYCTSGFDLSTFGGSEAQGPFWLEGIDGSMQGPQLKRSFYRVFGCWLGIVMRQLSLFFRWVSLRLPVSRRRSKNSDGHRKKTFAHIIQGLDQLTLSWDPVVGKEVVVGRWFSFPAKCRTLIVTIIK